MKLRPQSAKQKGRSLQQWLRDQLQDISGLGEDDVRSTSMGASGEDILLSTAAREFFPMSFECKNVERLNIWEAYEQCIKNSGNFEPVLVVKRNRNKPLVVVDAEWFLKNFKNDKN